MRELNHGIALIEILVTLLLISLTSLAISSAQLASARAVSDASDRIRAVQLAQDLAERMRAATGHDARQVWHRFGTLPDPGLSTSAGTCRNAARACATAQLAGAELRQWQALLLAELSTVDGVPSGGLTDPTACIEGPPNAGPGWWQLTLVWRGRSAGKNPQQRNLSCGNSPGRYGPGNPLRRVHQLSVFLK